MYNGFAADLARFGPDSSFQLPSLATARNYCSQLSRGHYENFTVASLLLPRRLLPHFHAVYAYCRWADDLGDETGGGEKALALLGWWREELLRCYEGQPRHPVMVALRETIKRFQIPPQPFLDLLLAFEQDQLVKRYQTFEQLLGYCRYSANPVGHLVLYLCESFSPDRAVLSDHVCTALQLANFWQDVGRDFDIGRVYLPEEDCRRFDYADVDLESRLYTPTFVELMRFEVERTRDLFYRGFPLLDRMPADVRADIELFIRGGLAILRKIEGCGYNVWQARPALAKWEKAGLLGRALWQRLRAQNRQGDRETGRQGEAGARSVSLSPCLPVSLSLSASYDYCRRLARRAASNFYPAFFLLPRAQRQSMCALYAFLRVSDDLSDGFDSVPVKRNNLETWRRQLRQALAGEYSHPLHAALHHTVETYGIPHQYLNEAIDGAEMDLDVMRYETIEDLYRYCYRAASVVGLSCIRIWGCKDARAGNYAEAAGIAFQLTNILRDLREDSVRGRIYLPIAELKRFSYSEEQLFRCERNEQFRALMRFECERARSYYDAAQPLADLLPRAGRSVILLMTSTYRGLLEDIERRDYDVFSSRASLSGWRKLWLAARVLPVRWGLRK